jgi:adsorption protein B
LRGFLRRAHHSLVQDVLVACLNLLDRCASALIPPLICWILLNGIDDLVPLVLWLKSISVRRASSVWDRPLPGGREKHTAIFVPLWREHRVIGRMLERNIGAIQYCSYNFFVGAYPNDSPTIDAVRGIAERHQNVHLALCPHEGPTSKADCLNWIFQRMLLYEEQHDVRFDVVVIHDAEDLIHPRALEVINRCTEYHEMVQVPVIPLATPLGDVTHGLYCDDFAESQTKDMAARQSLGSFIPSCGVGTGFSRRALETLAQAESNRIFEPSCLTEDYENGLRLSLLGCSQVFVPLERSHGSWMATREYFPRNLRSAIRQRTRWITGIALQTWERHGWCRNPRHLYWLWRDRKNLLGSPASLLANLLSFYGVVSFAGAWAVQRPWGMAAHLSTGIVGQLLPFAVALQIVHLSVRILCSARLYGLRFALAVPIRAMWGNWINGQAALSAMRNYGLARLRRQPLTWVKTEHSYPTRSALVDTHRELGDILVGSGYVTSEQLALALDSKGSMRLGEFLLTQGTINSEDLCEMLALQQNLPCGRIEPTSIPPNVARSLPAGMIDKWKVIPFRIFAGDVFLAITELPGDELQNELRRFTRLELRFHLVTVENFYELREQLVRIAKPETNRPPSSASRSEPVST